MLFDDFIDPENGDRAIYFSNEALLVLFFHARLCAPAPFDHDPDSRFAPKNAFAEAKAALEVFFEARREEAMRKLKAIGAELPN